MAGTFGGFPMPAALADILPGTGFTEQQDAYQTALADFFGPTSNTTAVQAYSYFPTTNQTLPDAYHGRSLFLNDTIEGLILDDNEIYVRYLLPWLETDQLTFQFNTFIFNPTLPTIVPHEGVSRLITSSTSSQKFTTLRRGIAFRMEGDFADTAQGATQYVRNITQITQSCLELASMGVMQELINCKQYQREWSQQYREMNSTYEKIMVDERANFGACNIAAGRFELMLSYAKQVLDARHITADALVVWPGAKIHFQRRLNGDKAGYYRLGPQGLSTFERGPDALGTIDGVAIFEDRAFDVDISLPRFQPLERSVFVGEVYYMLFGSRRTETLNDSYRTSDRDIEIYSLPEDRFKPVSFKEAVFESYVFERRREEDYPLNDNFQKIVDEYNLKPLSERQKNHQDYLDNIGAYNSRSGESSLVRRLPMFVHHVESIGANLGPGLAVCETFADMDYDVLTDADVVQVAQTMPGGLPAALTASRFRDLGSRFKGTAAPQAAARKRNGGAAAKAVSPTDVQVRAPQMSPLSLQGYAAILSSAFPMTESANAFLYSSVNVAKKSVDYSKEMENNLFVAWLKQSMSAVSGTGKDDNAFNAALSDRKSLTVDVIGSFTSAPAEAYMSVREALHNALKKHLNDDGTYAPGSSFATLSAAVQRVRDSAASMQPVNAPAGRLLFAAFADGAQNPFATITSVRNNAEVVVDTSALTKAQKDGIATAARNFIKHSAEMEGRVILHGETLDNIQFSEATANEWAAAVQRNAKTASQKQAAQRTVECKDAYLAARADVEKAIRVHTQNALKHAGDADDFDFDSQADELQDLLYSDQSKQFSNVGKSWLERDESVTVAGGLTNRSIRAALFAADSAGGQFLALPINGKTFLALMDANAHLPVNILLWRLWIQVKMYTAVLMRSGYETGFSAYGHSNFALSSEAATKTIYGNFTYYYNSIVHNQKGVIHLRNAAFRGYEGGWNSKFLDGAGASDLNVYASRQRGSLLATMIPITENTFEFPINFVNTKQVINSDGEAVDLESIIELYGSYSMCTFYEMVHNLRDSVEKMDVDAWFIREYNTRNTIADLGTHKLRDPKTQEFSKVITGTGHLQGNKTGHGVKAVVETGGGRFPEQPWGLKDGLTVM